MNQVVDREKLAQVAQRYGLNFIITHGSAVRGRARPDSDLDVAVVAERPLGLQQLAALQGALADVLPDATGRDLDVKTLGRVDPLFRYEVVRDGILLFGDATAYEEFKAFATRAYEDARPLRLLERLLSRKYQRHLNALAASLG